ncbi:MAG: T9SS type A sorting domain-containing protein [Candidatus Zixiibacteriota bacterium]
MWVKVQYQQNKTLYDLDVQELTYIRELAYECPTGLGTSNARAILELLYREEVPECPPEMGTKSMKLQKPADNTSFITGQNSAWLGDNYPEPLTNSTIIPYYIPQNTKGKIIIRDMQGRMIADFQLETGTTEIEINTKGWSSGIYMYGLVVDDVLVEFKKMTIGR